MSGPEYPDPGSKGSARARTPLGQHFLRREALGSSLVSHASIAPSDTVVEIGPGRGVLTRPLARAAARVLAVEIDPKLCARLERELADCNAVEVVRADFLHWPLPEGDYKVFANIPFLHTTAIVRRLSAAPTPPSDAWLLVEQAAARRLAGAPYGPEGALSLSLKTEWHLELVAEVEPGEFSPPARMRCSLLWLARRGRPLVAREQLGLYRDFTATVFARGGATLERALRGLLTPTQVQRCARRLRFDRRAVPSALGFEQWLGLFRCFARLAPAAARRHVRGKERRRPR